MSGLEETMVFVNSQAEHIARLRETLDEVRTAANKLGASPGDVHYYVGYIVGSVDRTIGRAR